MHTLTSLKLNAAKHNNDHVEGFIEIINEGMLKSRFNILFSKHIKKS